MSLALTRRTRKAAPAREHGTSLIEGVSSVVLLGATLAVGLDFTLILIGYQINSAVCREAARAASMTAPSRSDKNEKLGMGSPLYKSAWEVFSKRASSGNCWIGTPVLSAVSVDRLHFTESAGVGSAISGYVTVSSATTVAMPVVVQNVTPLMVTLQATFCYPLTAVTPPSQ